MEAWRSISHLIERNMGYSSRIAGFFIFYENSQLCTYLINVNYTKSSVWLSLIWAKNRRIFFFLLEGESSGTISMHKLLVEIIISNHCLLPLFCIISNRRLFIPSTFVYPQMMIVTFFAIYFNTSASTVFQCGHKIVRRKQMHGHGHWARLRWWFSTHTQAKSCRLHVPTDSLATPHSANP